MNVRANELASQFQRANDDVIAFVSSCDDTTWNMPCEGEGWSIGGVAAHIADGHRSIVGWVRDIVAGRPITVTRDELNQANAARAAANATRSREEILAALRARGAAAVESVRALSDDELARTGAFGVAGGAAFSAEQLIERTLTGHPLRHLASMRASSGKS